MSEDGRTKPSIRSSVPSASDQAPAPAGRRPEPIGRPEPVVWTPPPKGPDPRWTRWVTGAATAVFALCVAYGGVEAWGAGLFKLHHEQREQRPLGFFLIGLGMVMVFVLPVLLLFLRFRRRRPRGERDPWATDAE